MLLAKFIANEHHLKNEGGNVSMPCRMATATFDAPSLPIRFDPPEKPKFRFELTRRWGPRSGQYLTCVGLNPSIADHMNDDQTIRVVTKLGREGGFVGLRMLNIWPGIATDPKQLKRDNHADLINLGCLSATSNRSSLLLMFGAMPRKLDPQHLKAVLEILARIQERQATSRVFCVGTTKDGSPRHVLRTKLQLVDFDLRRYIGNL